jgi:hypothetical protein
MASAPDHVDEVVRAGAAATDERHDDVRERVEGFA